MKKNQSQIKSTTITYNESDKKTGVDFNVQIRDGKLSYVGMFIDHWKPAVNVPECLKKLAAIVKEHQCG